jgi:hypothetical protein
VVEDGSRVVVGRGRSSSSTECFSEDDAVGLDVEMGSSVGSSSSR